MNLSEEQFNIIQKYLRDDLSEKDQVLFDEWSGDSNFRKELLDQVSILNAVETSIDTDLKNEINSWSGTTNNLKDISSETKGKSSVIKYLVVLLLLLGAFWIYKIYSPVELDYKQVYASNFQVIPRENNQRGSEELYHLKYTEAMEFYGQGEYLKALDKLNEIEEVSPKIKSYKAICQMKLSKYNKAEVLWKEIEKEGDNEEIQNAEWYRLLISVYKSNQVNIDDQLEEILSNPNHLFHKKAIALSTSLK